MARKKTDTRRPIESYEHRDKQRVNNPPVGLVTPDTDPDAGVKKTYAYDPHLDPQLVWAGKAEHTSFDVPTVSLHVHCWSNRMAAGDSLLVMNSLLEKEGMADQADWDFHSGKYRGRTGQKQQGGIPAVSWNSSRLIGGIGDFVGDLAEFGVTDLEGPLCQRSCRVCLLMGI